MGERVLVDGTTTYRVRGLDATATGLSAAAGDLRDQVGTRLQHASRALDELHGPVARVFRQQVTHTLSALADLAATVDEAAKICQAWPSAGGAGHRPTVPDVPGGGADDGAGADPAALRSFASAMSDMDDRARGAALDVDLDGVSATRTDRRVIPYDGSDEHLYIAAGVDPADIDRSPTVIIEGPDPVPPATLVHLPDAAMPSALLTATSMGLAQLARRAADAFESADRGPLGFLDQLELWMLALQLQQSDGASSQLVGEQVQLFWAHAAAERAGFDLDDWDPSAGADANREIIEAVYRYYGDLYLEDPNLQWAGMANMIGPSFAAGFFDLDAMRGIAQEVEGRIDQLPLPVRLALPPHLSGVGLLADASDAELAFFEETFLSMQREIFLDQAVMHEAYRTGGMDAIEQLLEVGHLDARTHQAWQDIAEGSRTGDADLLASGNTHLLHREQWQIIRDDYDQMYDHGVTGPGFTYLMTAIGVPSIPGANGYAHIDPLTLSVNTPGPDRFGTPDRVGTPERIGPFGIPSVGVDIPSVSVDNPADVTFHLDTPLPGGNIADVNDRWRLITEDTLPAYQELLAENPDLAEQLISADVADRIDDYRLHHRVDDIIGQLVTDWDLRVEQ